MALSWHKANRVDRVAAWRLCMGCGACQWACPSQAVSLRDVEAVGIRPLVNESKCENCGKCVTVCPGVGLSHEPFSADAIEELRQAWGPVLQVVEGYASDDKVRFAGSSGGVATALALYAVERGKVLGVLHIGADPDSPLKNVPTFSADREDLLKCQGSRYAPAAPCQAFDEIKRAGGPCMFIGKPCDVAALRKAQKIDPDLDSKVALAVSIFCAGTPTTKGTTAVLEALGIDDAQCVTSFRYRGNGWPGMASASVKGEETEREMTYATAWGSILSRHSQLRCRLCPDSTGEFADISCGDPWYRDVEPGELGRSLLIIRTSKGREYLEGLLNSKMAKLEPVAPRKLPQSQESVLQRRKHLWGRLLTLRLLFAAIPDYKGFCLGINWQELTIKQRMRAVAGTIRRTLQRNWYKPLECDSKWKT